MTKNEIKKLLSLILFGTFLFTINVPVYPDLTKSRDPIQDADLFMAGTTSDGVVIDETGNIYGTEKLTMEKAIVSSNTITAECGVVCATFTATSTMTVSNILKYSAATISKVAVAASSATTIPLNSNFVILTSTCDSVEFWGKPTIATGTVTDENMEITLFNGATISTITFTLRDNDKLLPDTVNISSTCLELLEGDTVQLARYDFIKFTYFPTLHKWLQTSPVMHFNGNLNHRYGIVVGTVTCSSNMNVFGKIIATGTINADTITGSSIKSTGTIECYSTFYATAPTGGISVSTGTITNLVISSGVVTGGELRLYSRTAAELRALAPKGVGGIIWCSDYDSKGGVFVSTGISAGQWVSVSTTNAVGP